MFNDIRKNPQVEQLKTYLYILQSCEYNIGSFLKWFRQAKDKKLEQKKKELVWTPKARIIFVLTLLLWSGGLIALTIYFFIVFQWYWAILATVILTTIWRIMPVFLLLIPTILLKPLEKIYLFIYLSKAKKKLVALRCDTPSLTPPQRGGGHNVIPPPFKGGGGCVVIGITGSYGKTSVKEFLATILKEKYNILVTPENINTPIGIARLILNNLNQHHEIFIVEMGAYRRGDIKKLCNLVHPQIGILTGINESHLEKFRTIENTIKTKFELIESLPKDGLAIINGDDERCRGNYKRYIKCETKLYSLRRSLSAGDSDVQVNVGVPYQETPAEQLIESENSRIRLINYQQLEKSSKFGIIIPDSPPDRGGKGGVEVNLEVNLLGKHNILNILPGILIGEKLGLDIDQIRRGVKNIQPIPHRLQPIIAQNNILIIDDAYNGNFEGVMAAIEVLKNYKNRRKIFATPGLVELGSSRGEVHKKIGLKLAEVADLVLLIQNSNTEFFLQGLKEKKYPEKQIKIYQTSQELNNDLKNILKSGDVILFQNDWPDSYL
jgi:UDP-N-acetylmuramoyl-tripeptide--D-alanyl-D-alanine ligase